VPRLSEICRLNVRSKVTRRRSTAGKEKKGTYREHSGARDWHGVPPAA